MWNMHKSARVMLENDKHVITKVFVKLTVNDITFYNLLPC